MLDFPSKSINQHIPNVFNYYLCLPKALHTCQTKEKEKQGEMAMMMMMILILICSLVLAEGQTLSWKNAIIWKDEAVHWGSGLIGIKEAEDERCSREAEASQVDNNNPYRLR